MEMKVRLNKNLEGRLAKEENLNDVNFSYMNSVDLKELYRMAANEIYSKVKSLEAQKREEVTLDIKEDVELINSIINVASSIHPKKAVYKTNFDWERIGGYDSRAVATMLLSNSFNVIERSRLKLLDYALVTILSWEYKKINQESDKVSEIESKVNEVAPEFTRKIRDIAEIDDEFERAAACDGLLKGLFEFLKDIKDTKVELPEETENLIEYRELKEKVFNILNNKELLEVYC